MVSLDQPLCNFGEGNVYTIGDSCTGFHVFGGTGSGKTSGSGNFLAREMLRSGYGGLVLTFKPDEARAWKQIASEPKINRADDLIIVRPDMPYRFDFMAYEQKRDGEGAGKTINMIHLLDIALEMINPQKQEGSSGGDNSFFEMASRELLTSIIDLIKASGKSVTLVEILQLISSLPLGAETDIIRGNRNRPDGGIEEVSDYAFSFNLDDNARTHKFWIVYHLAIARQKAGLLSKLEAVDAGTAMMYLFYEYAKLSDRTRTSIQINATTSLYSLIRGDVGEIFASNIPKKKDHFFNPERTFKEGKIIILDMPVSEWGVSGTVVQSLYKFIFQKAMDRRDVRLDPKPVFLWADEAQHFINKYDQTFLTTARSTRCSTVFLTQNIENYYSILGEHRTKSLLGNFQTKIFHQNTDLSTNHYASEIIGEYWTNKRGFSFGGDKGTFSKSEDKMKLVEPEVFTTLKTGGTQNKLVVEGLFFSGLKRFKPPKSSRDKYPDDVPFKKVSFRQA